MVDFSQQHVWIVAGPTASGKSALAVDLAEQSDGVVINADSMQIYREIPVISAQPDAEERKAVPHVLYGFQSVAHPCSAADWAQRAIVAIEDTFEKGKQPILVGGSGLYLKALTEGFSPMPEVPPAIRRHICDLYDMLGPQGFHEALRKIDPITADRLHPTDRQRCIRAREIFEVSGAPLSSWQKQPKECPAGHLQFKTILLMPDREWLYGRINKRFESMVKHGALDEARAVQKMDLQTETTGLRAVGLQGLRDYLDHQLTLDEAIEMGQTQSRQYAKRQYTWFRGQALPNSHTIDNDRTEWINEARAYFIKG